MGVLDEVLVASLYAKSVSTARTRGTRSGQITEHIVTPPANAPVPDDVREIVVRRSPRRRRTVAARREGDRIIVMVPAKLSQHEEQECVRQMLRKLEAGRVRHQAPADDDALMARAQELSRQYLDSRARPTSVRWVSNQRSRWGSCTPANGTIRLSDRLRPMPQWVIDSVLVHELAHLLHADHGQDFYQLMSAYPFQERARGFLEGWSAAEEAGLATTTPGTHEEQTPQE